MCKTIFSSRWYRRRVGLTLLEVLIVLSIIGLLLSLLIPAVSSVRQAAGRVRCASQMRQLALAVTHYNDLFSKLPPGQLGPYQQFKPGIASFGWGVNSKGWSWLARILPQLEQEAMYRQAGVPDALFLNNPAVSQSLAILQCPADPSSQKPSIETGNFADVPLSLSNYKAVSGANWGYDRTQNLNFRTPYRNPSAGGSYDGLDNGDGAMFRTDIFQPRNFNRFVDGLSQTYLIGEDVPEWNAWLSWSYANHGYGTCAIPLNLPTARNARSRRVWYQSSGFKSRHADGANFALADGSVRFVKDSISLSVYRAYATIAGGETVASE